MIFKRQKTRSKLVESSKPITISLPTNKLDKNQIRRSFMPNLIHSLDASNIHLIIPKLKNIPIYTIHDCFATSVNNMVLLDFVVKSTFINIYFGDFNFMESMHTQLIKQITDNVHSEDLFFYYFYIYIYNYYYFYFLYLQFHLHF